MMMSKLSAKKNTDSGTSNPLQQEQHDNSIVSVSYPQTLLRTLISAKESSNSTRRESQGRMSMSFILRRNDDNESAGERRDLSGMLLSHCLIYKNGLYDVKNSAYNANSYPPAVPAAMSSPSYEFGALYSKISADGISSRTIPLSEIDNFCNMNQLNPVRGSPKDTIIWLHIISEDAIVRLFNNYKLEPIGLKSFMDKSPRSYVHRKQNVLVAQIVTTSINGSVISAKILHSYVSDRFIITYERQMYVVTQTQPDVRISISDIDTVRKKSFVSTSLFVNSTATHVRSSSDQINNNLTERITAAPVNNNIPEQSNSSSSSINDGRSINMHDDTCNMDGIHGLIVDKLSERLQQPVVRQLLIECGSSYLFYEATSLMLSISYPVIDFISKRMLRLHDAVFVRREKPGHIEGNMLRDQIDTLEACINLLALTLDHTYDALKDGDNRAKLSIIPEEWFSDMLASYKYTTSSVSVMKTELLRIEANLNELIVKRNDRITLLLSMVATVFLPLSFVTGVFGMNFSSGGPLVYVLRVANGSLAFWILFLLIVLTIFYWFYVSGFFDILFTPERNKHTEHYEQRRINGTKNN